MTERFFVQTVLKGKLQSFLWDGGEPLLIGFPAHALLERTDAGVRVRNLDLKKSEQKKIAELRSQPTLYANGDLTVKVRPLLAGGLMDASALRKLTHTTHPVGEEDVRGIVRKLVLLLAIIGLLFAIWGIFLAPKTVPLAQEPISVKFVGQTKPEQATGNAQESTTTPQLAASGSGQSAKAAARSASRVKALRSSIQGILKGGVGAFMRDSQSLKVSSNLSDSGSQLSKSLGSAGQVGQEAGTSTGPNAQIIGGEGSGGYAKAGAGKVAGQGQIQIDLDLTHSTVAEGLTKDEVGRVIHAHMAEIRYCYESSLLRNPDLEGKMEVDFVINSSGVVKTSDVKSSTLNEATLEDCVTRKLSHWRFPKPKGGVEVAVTYPFIFKSLGR